MLSNKIYTWFGEAVKFAGGDQAVSSHVLLNGPPSRGSVLSCALDLANTNAKVATHDSFIDTLHFPFGAWRYAMPGDHAGHSHGGDGPPWLNRLTFWLTIGLVIIVVASLILHKLGILH